MRLGRLVTLAIAVVVVALVSVVTVVSVGPNVVLATESACASDGAVPDAANNPGLVSDCAVLLAARDTLAGTATLNWAADTPIAEWDGIQVWSSPEAGESRVVDMSIPGFRRAGDELTGKIPVEFGELSYLGKLDLHGNKLTGEIPTELGNLSNLGWLDLGSNELTGTIPTELGNLPETAMVVPLL